jgi:uncharacterized protein (DUF1778 family)
MGGLVWLLPQRFSRNTNYINWLNEVRPFLCIIRASKINVMTDSIDIAKRERLHLRLDPVAKRKLEQAAAYSQKSLSEFVLTHAVHAAEQVIQTHETLVLDDHARDLFFEAILNPPKSNQALRDALKWYDELG